MIGAGEKVRVEIELEGIGGGAIHAKMSGNRYLAAPAGVVALPIPMEVNESLAMLHTGLSIVFMGAASPKGEPEGVKPA